MTEDKGLDIGGKEEMSAILDTIDGGDRVRLRKGKPRTLVASVNLYTSRASGAVPDLMEIEPTRFLR